MTWINRLRLTGGLLGVLALLAILTVVFNQRQTSTTSMSATVAADQYDLSAAYGGTVVKQYVAEGDSVSKGDKLFTVQSPDFQQDLSQGIEISDTEAFSVNTNSGTLTYKAVVDGKLTELESKLGNSLTTGRSFAKITVGNTQYVDAYYLLSPRDYARVEKGADVKILLPNNQTIPGNVATIKVETENGQAMTNVGIESDAIREAGLESLNQPGTPVAATVQLRDDGPLAGTRDLVLDFFGQIGLG